MDSLQLPLETDFFFFFEKFILFYFGHFAILSPSGGDSVHRLNSAEVDFIQIFLIDVLAIDWIQLQPNWFNQFEFLFLSS